MTASYFPCVVQLETCGVMPQQGWPRFICLGASTGTDGRTMATVQDSQGMIYGRVIQHGYDRMRRVNMTVDDFLVRNCTLED